MILKRIIVLFILASQYCYAQDNSIDSLLKQVPHLKDDTTKSKLLIEVSRKYYEKTDYINAQLYADKSYTISKKLNFSPGIIDYYSLDGRLLKNNGKYYEAKYQYEEALALSEKIKDYSRIASSYNNLGNLYIQLRDPVTALSYLNKSLSLFNKIKDIKKSAYPLSNIGRIYLDKKQYDSALYYFQNTIQISHAYQDDYELAQSYKRIASIYTELGNYTKAFAYCDTCLNISNTHLYRYIIADIYEIQAKIYLARKEYKKSKKILEKCLLLYHQLQVKPSIQYCYKQLSKIDSIEGNFASAYNHYKMYHLYNDSLVDLENRINIEKQRLKHTADNQEFIAKRKRNILYIIIVFLALTSILVIYIIRQQQLSRRKIAIAETKNRISQDLHDEIGSTLSSISLQTEVLKKRLKNKENIEELIDIIKNESRKTMSTMNDIVWSLNTENENFNQFLNRLKNYCSMSLATSEISYKIQVEENLNIKKNDLYLFKEVYLIAKEFINNSLKYSQCSHIQINICKITNTVYIEIFDDGIGFDTKNSPVSMGGTGIKNMEKRAKAIKAFISLKSHKNIGTSLNLSWKDI